MSNVRQVGLGFAMYVQDYDETTVIINEDWWQPIYPYFKNYSLLLCPDRNDRSDRPASELAAVGGAGAEQCQGTYANGDGIKCRISGYAYNWGPLNSRGGGLTLQKAHPAPGQPDFAPGISLASIVAPAQTFAFGDTYDTPRMNLGMFTYFCDYNGTTISGLRHRANFNMAFADGHAKAVKIKAGFAVSGENNRFGRPASTEMVSDYCADPNATVYPQTGAQADLADSIPIGPIRCGDIGAKLDASFGAPCSAGDYASGGSSTANGCIWTN